MSYLNKEDTWMKLVNKYNRKCPYFCPSWQKQNKHKQINTKANNKDTNLFWKRQSRYFNVSCHQKKWMWIFKLRSLYHEIFSDITCKINVHASNHVVKEASGNERTCSWFGRTNHFYSVGFLTFLPRSKNESK